VVHAFPFFPFKQMKQALDRPIDAINKIKKKGQD